MKAESLVIADQHVAVIRSRALYTPPVTPWKLTTPEVVALTFGKQAPKEWLVTGVKS